MGQARGQLPPVHFRRFLIRFWLLTRDIMVRAWARGSTHSLAWGRVGTGAQYSTPLHYTLHTSTLNTQDNSTTASEEKGPDADALMSHTGNNHRAGFHAAAQLFTAPDSATLCSIYTHLEDALQKPRQPEVTEGHGGEWRSVQMSQWCKLSESDEGDAMCAHGPEIIDKPHWSCCGVEAEGKPCTEGGTAKGGDVYIGQRMPASLLLVSFICLLHSASAVVCLRRTPGSGCGVCFLSLPLYIYFLLAKREL